MQVAPTAVNQDDYLLGLLDQVSLPKAVAWLQELRQGAANWVDHSHIPTHREEEWRFTDLSGLRQVQFQLATPHLPSPKPEILPEAANSRLVFVNGVYAPDLSAVTDIPAGILVTNLTNLPTPKYEQVRQYLGQSPGTPEVFTALNTAGLTDGALVWVGRNVKLETPIHLVFVTVADATPIISQPRCLVVVETGSQVNLIEEYVGTPVGVYLTNAVTEIYLAGNAEVVHTRVEREGKAAFHIGKTAVTQGRDSRYTSYAITLGANLSRQNLEVWQTGEQTQTTLQGLTVIGGSQLADTHSTIAFNYPHGVSQQLHKCIVSDRAHGVFNGKIIVPKPAQLTDAAQLNRNLLLSPKARVDTKPQLEITADNVKCAHGATVIQLEDDEIFYLQSRGINETDARKLLVNAFAGEIIHQIPVPSLRAILLNIIHSHYQ